MANRQDRRCYRRFIRVFVPSFSLFQPSCFLSPSCSHGFNWNRGWRAGEREIFFSFWPWGKSFIGSRLCRRARHSAYLKCIVDGCAGGYVSVNVTEFQSRRKIAFHADGSNAHFFKNSGLFVEPRTINFFFKILRVSFFISNSLSFFFYLIRCPIHDIHEPKNSLRHAKCWEQPPISPPKRTKLPIPLLCNYILRAVSTFLTLLFVFLDNNEALSSFFVLSLYCNPLWLIYCCPLRCNRYQLLRLWESLCPN